MPFPAKKASPASGKTGSGPRVRIRSGRTIQRPDTTRRLNLSRTDALNAIAGLLRKNPTHPEAITLIELFHIDPEELTEHGLNYEQLKVLQEVCLHLKAY